MNTFAPNRAPATLANLVLLLLIALGGCGNRQDASSSDLPVVNVRIGASIYMLEVADEPAEREKGLMHRDSMPLDRGMLFVFPDEAQRQFWMANTRIPLDLIYLSRDGRVVSIHALRPFDLSGVRSRGAAQFAIELNQGEAARVGLRIGDTIELPQDIAAAVED